MDFSLNFLFGGTIQKELLVDAEIVSIPVRDEAFPNL